MKAIYTGLLPDENRGDLAVVVIAVDSGYKAIICDTAAQQAILTHERNPDPVRVYHNLSADAAAKLAAAVRKVEKDGDLPSLDAVVIDPMLVKEKVRGLI